MDGGSDVKRNEIRSNVNKKAMIDALEKNLGVVTYACRDVGINPKTHYEWLKTDEEYKKSVEEVAEMSIDFVENSLYKQIKDMNTAATIFYLKTKGRKRGYSENAPQDVDNTYRATVTLPDGTQITL